MNQFNYNNKSIHYAIVGEGKPVVFIHGFCEDLTMWEDFIPMLPQHQYILIDLPGFGKSEAIDDTGIEDMADVVKHLLDHLEIQKAVVIGHSMGGYVSLAFAKKYESRLIGLGLFHSHPYADSDDKKTDRTKQSDFIENYGSAHYVKQLVPKLFPEPFVRFNQFLIDKLVHRANRFPAEGLRNGLHAMRDRNDQTETLAKIQVPVLFIVGKKDGTMTSEQGINQTVIPKRSMIKIFPEVGHMGMFEAPRKTAGAVREFLKYCG